MRLTQEKYRGDPWKILVTCLMLNKTAGRVANPIIEEFLRRWPTPAEYAKSARKSEVLRLIRPLGLYNVRLERLEKLARSLVKKVPYDQIPGVGKYGRDSYLMFVENRLDVLPDDEKLKAYLREKKKERGSS